MTNPIHRRSLLAGLAGTTALAASGLPIRAAESSASVKGWDRTVDVIVAGSGSAGVSAAIEARRAGLDVLLLEKFRVLGGSSGMSGGVCYLGGGTALQKALRITDSVQAMHDYIMAASALYPDPEKVQLYCEQSAEHFDWLVANGVKYTEKFSAHKELPGGDESLYYSGNERGWPYREQAHPAPRGHVPGYPGWNGGRALMEALIASAKTLGVTIATEVGGLNLVQDTPGGRVAGMVVDWQGETRRIRARRGVVLACGGFIHNREMVKVFAPELYDGTAPWGNAGDLGIGIQMGMGAGGAVARMNQGFAIMPLYEPDYILRGIAVNRHGQRFIGEDCYHAFLGHEITYNQGGKAWLVTDEDSSYKHQDYRITVQAQAGTIAELERAGGFPEGALVATVDYYNRFAADKRDPPFGKNPEFLAPLAKPPFKLWNLSVDTAFFTMHTFGGLHTNTDAQVLNGAGEPIEALYAAGRTSWGLPSAPYIGSGISVGDCTFFGRRAGRHLGGVA